MSWVRLDPGVQPRDVLAGTPAVFDQGVGSTLSVIDTRLTGHAVYRAQLTPFRDVHLNSATMSDNLTPAGSWTTIY
ncbi:hypothetical protein ABTG19_19150, partial [Acinetobacter baumannii]